TISSGHSGSPMGQGCGASSPQNEAAAADLSPTSQDALSPGTKSFYPRQGATSKYLIGWKKPGGTMNSVDFSSTRKIILSHQVDTQERWRPEGFNLPFLVLSPGDLTAPESSELEQERKRKQQLQDSVLMPLPDTGADGPLDWADLVVAAKAFEGRFTSSSCSTSEELYVHYLTAELEAY
ncbi:hypothetical protein GOODEAATRI_011763, partial [Goodea atripinnis]